MVHCHLCGAEMGHCTREEYFDEVLYSHYGLAMTDEQELRAPHGKHRRPGT
jgi:hypothetical protein